MLYKLNLGQRSATELEPIPFSNLSEIGKLEKDLENILADNLLDVLFEDERLMPIFQERRRQSEADLYALDQQGDLVIFGLKRGEVGAEVVPQQLLRYAQDASRWPFSELERRFDDYQQAIESTGTPLAAAHKEAFGLEHELQPNEFNRR